MKNAPSVAIIGAGIIGLSCAWELSRRGAKVTLYEKSWPPRGASWAAAGMLAPAYEAAAEDDVHPDLFDLCTQSAEMWADFSADLEAESGIELGYQAGPSLAVAANEAEFQHLTQLSKTLSFKSVSNSLMDQKALQSAAPNLSKKLLGGLQINSDGQVDNRRVIEALIKVLPPPQPANVSHFGKPYDFVLQANGWVNGHCEPVKGQMLSLTQTDPPLSGVVHSNGLYIVPKADRVVIGATSEPGQIDTTTERDVIYDMRRKAVDICPPLHESAFIEIWAGIRPVTPDSGPVFARAGNALTATGHGRNGILLAPITAKIMAEMVLDGKTPDLAAAFTPDRFIAATA